MIFNLTVKMNLFSYSPKNQVTYEIEIESETHSNKEAKRKTTISNKKCQVNSPKFSYIFNSNTEIRRRNDSQASFQNKTSKSKKYGIKAEENHSKKDSKFDIESIQDTHLFTREETKQCFCYPKSAKNEEIVKNCSNRILGNSRSKSVNKTHNYPIVNERLNNRSFRISKINAKSYNRNKLQIRPKSVENHRIIPCNQHINFLYEESFNKKQKLKKQIEKNQERKDLIEMTECTFRPKISTMKNQEIKIGNFEKRQEDLIARKLKYLDEGKKKMEIIYNKMKFSPRLMNYSKNNSITVQVRKKELDIFRYLYELGQKSKQKKNIAAKRKEIEFQILNSKDKKERIHSNNLNQKKKYDRFKVEPKNNEYKFKFESKSTRNEPEVKSNFQNFNFKGDNLNKNTNCDHLKNKIDSQSHLPKEHKNSKAKESKYLETNFQYSNKAKSFLLYPNLTKRKANNELNEQYLTNQTKDDKLFKEVDKNQNKKLLTDDSLLIADKIGKCAGNLLKLKAKLQSNISNGNLNEDEFIKMAIELGIK